VIWILLLWLAAIPCAAQPAVERTAGGFALRCEHDSLYFLRCERPAAAGSAAAGSTAVRRTAGRRPREWRLPYPVYRFLAGDIDGDGRADALVGVVKPTRFDPRRTRRLFIFRQVSGQVRPLWLGSRLGGMLEDFRYVGESPHSPGDTRGGRIRSLESTADGRYVVAEYRWSGFGMAFDHYIIKGVDRQTARRHFRR